MSLYISHEDVPAFHQEGYPKRRPSRSRDVRLAQHAPQRLPGSVGSGALGISYQEFIDGAYQVDAVQLTA